MKTEPRDQARSAQLAGRVALVTGGLSGVGAAVAERLAHDGCDVAILSLGTPAVEGELRHFEPSAEAQSMMEKLGAEGVRSIVVEGDVARRSDLERALERAAELGEIDILVNNAATNAFQSLVDHDEALWRRVIEVNLIAPFLACQVFLPAMVARGWGRVVSIASTNAHIGSAGYTAYCASKHGLLGLTRALALEVAGTGVTANTVSPSFIDTAGAQIHVQKHADVNGVSYDEMLARVLDELPQKRFIYPDEVAAAVAFLCSNGAESVNGADIPVTGGATW